MRLRTRAAAVLTALIVPLGGSLVLTGPAHADPLPDLGLPIPGLPGSGSGSGGSGGGEKATGKYPMAQYAKTSRKDGRLVKGCHRYRYHYAVKPPTQQWALETFLRDPDGRRIASGALVWNADPKRGYAYFKFCRPSTSPGRFTIRGKLTLYNGDTQRSGRIRPSHFHLAPPA